MKILVIGKPTYNIILPLASFLAEGSKNKIGEEKYEYGGGASFYAAALFAKWGAQVHYTGVVGSDIYGNKIKADLESYGVDIKYLETNYEHPTAMNYIVINKANGSSTQIVKENNEVNLVKYKYEFTPDYVIMDGTDLAGSFAAINNFPKATIILLANQINDQVHGLSKKATYVVASVRFAQALAKMELEVGKPKQLVAFLQKIKDLNKSEYVIMMREHGVLYSSERQVKMIPAIPINGKVDDSNSGNIFFSSFCYGMVHGYGIDNSVKMANIAAGLSLTKMGTIDSIPDLEEVLEIGSIQKPTVAEVHEENVSVLEENSNDIVDSSMLVTNPDAPQIDVSDPAFKTEQVVSEQLETFPDVMPNPALNTQSVVSASDSQASETSSAPATGNIFD